MKVLNFGSINYDYVYSVDHAVVPGETEASASMETHFGGKGLNQSMALARAGVPVYHAGCVGEDGGDFITLCKENGVDTTYIKTIPGKSGHTIIQVDKNAQNCILLFGGSNRSITRDFVDQVLAGFEKGDILLLQNEINELPYIVDSAYAKGMEIILNPSPFDAALDSVDMTKISIFLVNEIEGGQIAGLSQNGISGEKDVEQILGKMTELFPHSKIVLTLGSDGVVYKDANQTLKQDIFKVKAVDTTAAGDTFTGYFIAGLLEGMPMADILRRCCKASALAVSKMGAVDSIPGKEEVEKAKL